VSGQPRVSPKGNFRGSRLPEGPAAKKTGDAAEKWKIPFLPPFFSE